MVSFADSDRGNEILAERFNRNLNLTNAGNNIQTTGNVAAKHLLR
jgi:hypothetical protein